MIAISFKTVFFNGVEAAQIEALATETPDAMPQTTAEIIGVKQELPIYAGSTVWCADTSKKWILFDLEGSWVNTADTTESFSGGGGE